MNRRSFLLSGLSLPVLAGAASAAKDSFEVTRTEAEWRAMLTKAEYKVMREMGTERAGSSPLDKETRKGIFHCKGCDLALYSSEAKYDSGTGWPSFFMSLPNAVDTMPDRSWFVVRTEVHCRRCGSHLGHIFDDGPPPTGKRHCLNGISLVFRPA